MNHAAPAGDRGGQDGVVAALRHVRARARARARSGLLDEALATMIDLGFAVARCGGPEDIVRRLLEIVPAGAAVVSHPCVAGRALDVDGTLRAQGRRVVSLPGDGVEPGGPPSGGPEEWRAHLLAADTGITGANALVADTGSLLLVEDRGFGRAASNVPPVHIALVSADRVVETLGDAAVVARAYAVLHLNRPIPRYISLISGPSKTADIGFTLVRGMHGPRTVHVLVWDHLGAAGAAAGDDLKSWVLA